MSQMKMLIEGDCLTMRAVYTSYIVPILFRMDSESGAHYLFWEIMDDEAAEAWLVVQMSDADVTALENGRADVRELYERSSTIVVCHWFSGDVYGYLLPDQYRSRYQECVPMPPVNWYIQSEQIERK